MGPCQGPTMGGVEGDLQLLRLRLRCDLSLRECFRCKVSSIEVLLQEVRKPRIAVQEASIGRRGTGVLPTPPHRARSQESSAAAQVKRCEAI